MIELTISVVLQGMILATFLIIICVFIGWFEDLTGRSYRDISNRLSTLDVRIFCKSCFKMLLCANAVMGGRQNLGLLIAVIAATFYVGSTYMAFHNDIDCLQGVVAGWFLSIIAVAVAYDWRNPPPIVVSKVVLSVGVACKLFGMVALHYKLYHCLLVMGLAGAYTVMISGFLYMMNRLKSPGDELEDEIYEEELDEDEPDEDD